MFMKKILCVILALALCLGLCCAVAESSALPAYVYPFAEENPLMAGVVDCLMKTDFGYEPAEGTVMIPAPIVLKTEMNADETEATVWGNFWMFGYRLNGKILEATCGGDNPGVMKLVKQDGAWTAVSLEVAPVNGDRGSYLKEFSGGDELRSYTAKMLTDYAREHNNADITPIARLFERTCFGSIPLEDGAFGEAYRHYKGIYKYLRKRPKRQDIVSGDAVQEAR
jgi:hypothetical protein